uniref:Nectin cell adhesion molecule 3 n=1 Tax=Knipowitschia caucasica TaxID=637954 RepID=A0AAV2K100_KNICA
MGLSEKLSLNQSMGDRETRDRCETAKPVNNARVLTVQAGSKAVVVAQCEALEGKPAASINWLGSVGGNHSTSSSSGPDGTVTVKSEYKLVPTPADNGRELTCLVDQRTQDQTWVYPVKLSVEYPPSVSIEDYDHNWYMGRSNAVLTCLSNANPPPTTVTWTAVSGPLPDSVVVDGNKLTVRKVDEAVNTTFVCEVKNKLGSTKNQITTVVIGESRDTEPRCLCVAFVGHVQTETNGKTTDSPLLKTCFSVQTSESEICGTNT